MSALDIMGRIEGDRMRYHDELERLRSIVVTLSALAITMERRAAQQDRDRAGASASAFASASG